MTAAKLHLLLSGELMHTEPHTEENPCGLPATEDCSKIIHGKHQDEHLAVWPRKTSQVTRHGVQPSLRQSSREHECASKAACLHYSQFPACDLALNILILVKLTEDVNQAEPHQARDWPEHVQCNGPSPEAATQHKERDMLASCRLMRVYNWRFQSKDTRLQNSLLTCGPKLEHSIQSETA